jgi:sec-independent protein translocase protein TatA
MGGLSVWHWLVIGAVFILLFGAKRLPDAARGVGRSLRILKSEVGAMHLDEGQAADAAVTGDVPVSTIEPTPVGQAPAR